MGLRDNFDFYMALVAKAALDLCFWHKCRRRSHNFFPGRIGSEGRERGKMVVIEHHQCTPDRHRIIMIPKLNSGGIFEACLLVLAIFVLSKVKPLSCFEVRKASRFQTPVKNRSIVSSR